MEPTPPTSPEPGRAPIPGEPAGAPQGQQPPVGMVTPPGLQQQPGFLARLWQIKAAVLLFGAMLINFYSIYKEVGRLLIPPTQKNLKVLADNGLFVRQLVHDGEWWRHFTALVTPTGVIDLVICAWIFWSLGPMVERLLGTMRFLVLFLLAGAGGIALAELLSPDSLRWSGPWVGLYVVFGALPGMVFGTTFSLKKTLAHPGTRSCAFWVVLGLVFAYLSNTELKDQGGSLYDWQAQLSGMGIGVLLGFALSAITTKPPVGILASLVVGGATIGLVYASSTGKKLEGLGQDTGNQTRERDPDEKYIDTKDDVLSKEAAFIKEVEDFLNRWGPLPNPVVSQLSDAEFEQASDYLKRVNSLAKDESEIVGEFDPHRIRLMILLADYKAAIRLADEYISLESGSPQSEALAGAAYAAQSGSKHNDAVDHLQRAVNGEGLAKEWPEAVWLLGHSLYELHEDVLAKDQFTRFLRLTTERSGDGSHEPHRAEMIRIARDRLR